MAPLAEKLWQVDDIDLEMESDLYGPEIMEVKDVPVVADNLSSLKSTFKRKDIALKDKISKLRRLDFDAVRNYFHNFFSKFDLRRAASVFVDHVRKIRSDSSGLKGKLELGLPKLRFTKKQVESERLIMKPVEQLRSVRRPGIVVVLLVFALGAVVALGYFFFRENTLRKTAELRFATSDQAKIELMQEVKTLQSELDEQRKEMNRMVRDLEVAQAKANMIAEIQDAHRSELDRITRSYENQLKSMKTVLETRDELIRTFDSNLKAIRRLLEQGAPLPTQMPVQVNIKRAQNEDAESNITSSAKQSGLNFSPRENPIGEVKVINRENRFVIVNLGPDQGAQVGTWVLFYRDGKEIGSGKIERIYETLSAVTISSEQTLDEIRTGDEVYLTTL